MKTTSNNALTAIKGNIRIPTRAQGSTCGSGGGNCTCGCNCNAPQLKQAVKLTQ